MDRGKLEFSGSFSALRMTAKTTATADPPFDFAQGRLFGDDN
jgi:hypothetical protein